MHARRNRLLEVWQMQNQGLVPSFSFFFLLSCECPFLLFCKLNLTQSMIKCKCGYSFCSKHRSSWKHECAFDFKKENRANLRNELGSATKKGADLQVFAEYEQRYLLHHEQRSIKSLHAASLLLVVWYIISSFLFWGLYFRNSLFIYTLRTAIGMNRCCFGSLFDLFTLQSRFYLELSLLKVCI